MEPGNRLKCIELLDHSYFDGFRERVEAELQPLLAKSVQQNVPPGGTKSRKSRVCFLLVPVFSHPFIVLCIHSIIHSFTYSLIR